MKLILVLICLFWGSTFCSCKKEAINSITIEGVVNDSASKKPLSGIYIQVDAIKPSSRVGIITDGKRESVGQTRTDANGYYKLNLRVFQEAKRLEFSVNGGQHNEGYVEARLETDLSDMNQNTANRFDFSLNPTGLLRIKFKNATPVSDSDFFSFGWSNIGAKVIVQKENCGTVVDSGSLTWLGKDVCGAYTVETMAEMKQQVYWIVKKGAVTNYYSDSVFVKRDIVNEFSINY
jgi:hypothetical protein